MKRIVCLARFTPLAVIALMVIASCASAQTVKVVSFSPGVNPNVLTAFKTFSFYKLHVTGDAGLYFETNLDACKNAIASQMIARGFTEASNGGEMLINIGVILQVKNQQGVSTTQMRYMSEPNYTWHNQLKSQKNREGTITIEMVDASKKSGVWIGVFTGTAPKEEEGKLRNIEQGVKLLFKKFPVKVTTR